MTRKEKGHISQETFDDFLTEQGLLKEAAEIALKRVLAWQITETTNTQGISKTAIFKRMQTVSLID